ncbi:MAG: PadR family transcriptional regulator [Candidatus Bathyarchaeia archaeon]
MEEEIVKGLLDRFVRRFMDLIVLAELDEGRSISGYSCINLIRNKFHVSVSPGKVYSLLRSMERDGLVGSRHVKRKRVYTITDKGKETMETILNANKRFQSVIRSIFGEGT